MTCFAKNKEEFSRIVAIDPGMARCGLAISDPMGSFALPFKTLTVSKDKKDIAFKIFESFANENVVTVVFGMPLKLSGGKSSMTLWAETLFDELQQVANERGINLVTLDERLSSKQADVLLSEAGVKKQRRKQVQDSLAAALILQSYLDIQRFRSYQTSNMENDEYPI